MDALFTENVELPQDDQPIESEQVEQVEAEESEQVEESAVEEQPQEEKPKLVPLAALHEERKMRQQLQQEREQLMQERARYEERLRVLQEMAQKQPEPQIPDFDADPAGHLAANLTQTSEQIRAIKEQLSQQTQAQQQQAAEQQLRMAAHSAAQQFIAEQADYPDAYQFVRDVKAREWGAMGHTPEQVAQFLAHAERQISLQAFQRGENPARSLYNVAVALGYRAGVKQPDNLEAVSRGAKLKSLASGGKPSGGVSLESLASMSDEEFAKATQGDNWRKMFGG